VWGRCEREIVKEEGQEAAQRQWPTAQGFRDNALMTESKIPRLLAVHFIGRQVG
jgi:hypothetical protein